MVSANKNGLSKQNPPSGGLLGFFRILSTLCILLFSLDHSAHSQSVNPPCTNMGFENGNFDGWTGSVIRRSNNNVTGGTLQHCIMSPGMRDPFIRPDSFPVVPPGMTHAVRLGNTARGQNGANGGAGAGASGHIATLRQTFHVDSSNMLFTYHYAVVLEDPDIADPQNASSHEGLLSPHFQAKLTASDGSVIKCTDYSVIVSNDLQNYSRACVRVQGENGYNGNLLRANINQNVGCPSGSSQNFNININDANTTYPNLGDRCSRSFDLYYKTWRSVTVLLDKYLNQNVTIEFLAADCFPGGHLGYAYVAAECNRLNLALPGFICSGKETKRVSAPPGFKQYKWAANGGGLIVGADTGQFITISKAGTYIVTVTPFTSSEQVCDYPIAYVVQNRCSLTDTLCETIKQTARTTRVNLNDYNSKATANVSTSKVVSWHTGLPITNANKILDPTNATIGSQTYYAFITDPAVKNDTVGLTFTIIPKPAANFEDLPVFCVSAPPFVIKKVAPLGGTFSGLHVAANGVFTPSSTPGTFDITYMVTVDGCSDTITKKATVGTTAKIKASGDTMVCYKGTAIVIPVRSSASSGDSVIWSIPPGTGTISDKNKASTTLTLSGPAPFDHDFYAVVTQFNKTCPTSKDSILIRTRQLPSVAAPADEMKCTLGGPVSFNLQGQVLYEDSLRWDVATGTLSNKFNETAVAHLSTEYPDSITVKVILSAKKEACPLVKDSLFIKVQPIPTVTAGNDTSYCSSIQSFPLNAAALGHQNVRWLAKNINGQITDANSPSTSFKPSSSTSIGTGTFVITASSLKCGIARDSFDLTLTPGFDVSASASLTCLPDRRVLLEGTATSGNIPTEATWISSGTGNFSPDPETLKNAYIPSPQDIAQGSVTLSLATKTISKCPSSDTSFLWKIEPLPKLNVTTPSACKNSQIQLEANKINKAKYFWGTQSSTSANTYTTNIGSIPSAIKVLVVDEFGCKDSSMVNLAPLAYPAFTLQAPSLCHGGQGIIEATLTEPLPINDPSFSFQWKKEQQDLSTSTWDKFSFNSGGNYSLSLSLNKCTTTRSVYVAARPSPKIEMPLEYRYCQETDSTIKLTSPKFEKYFWHFENGVVETNSSITVGPSKTTKYRLVVANSYGCKDSVTVLVKSVCPPRLFVPNVITPHSSDVNSALHIFGAHYTNFEITIFNRWGEVIFNTKDPKNVWDGIYKLENMPIGTYPWIVTYEGDSEEYKGPYKKVGEVTIVR